MSKDSSDLVGRRTPEDADKPAPLRVIKQRALAAPKRVSFSMDLPRCDRSVTTGNTNQSRPPKWLSSRPLISLAPDPLVIRSRPRAATTGGSTSNYTGSEQTCRPLEHLVPRRSSSKRGLLSRMMGVKSSKQSSDQAVTERDYLLDTRRASVDAPRPSISEPQASTDGPQATSNKSLTELQRQNTPRPRTSSTSAISFQSSMNATSFFGSELDRTLTAFPSPPTNTLTSPETFSSMATTLGGAELQGTTCAPRYADIPGAEIHAVSEIAALDSDDGQSIFVAVEIKGILSQPQDGSCYSEQPYGLTVVVIIDNSLFTSPAALIASCETTRHLASLLDMPEDKLAVLCTSPEPPLAMDDSDSRIILPLSAVNLRRVKPAIDSIVCSTESPVRGMLKATLGYAKDLLIAPRTPTQSGKRSQTSCGHIFVLTSNPSELPSYLLHDRSLQIHLVCSGTVPWKGQDNVECNGWKLRSMYHNELQSISNKKDTDVNSLFNGLREVIGHARRATIAGQLTDLVLEVHAGINCSVEGIIGKKHYSSLRPGEVLTALIKVRVGPSSIQSPSNLTHNQASNTLPTSYDLLDELDLMLGASSATVLTAKLKYRHSLFPPGTRCSIIAKSCVKKSVLSVELEGGPSIQDGPQGQESKIWVQKRLVFHLATHHSPRHAFSTLHGEFGASGHGSVCPEYLKLVMEELKYQARVLERLDPFDVSTITANDGETLCEHFGEGLFDIKDFTPQEWMLQVPDEFDDDDGESEQAWTPRTSSQSGVLGLRNINEGEWLANTKPMNITSNMAKRAGKAWLPDHHQNPGSSEHSKMSGCQSMYSLNPLSRRAQHRDNSAPHLRLMEASDQNIRFGQAGTRISNPRSKNLDILNEKGSTISTIHRQDKIAKDSNAISSDSPNSPRIFHRNLQASQNHTQQQQPGSSSRHPFTTDSTDEAHQLWGDMRQKKDRLAKSHPAEQWPRIIVTKDERERARLMREMAVRNQRSLGEGTLRSFVVGEGGGDAGGGGYARGRSRKGAGGFGPWA